LARQTVSSWVVRERETVWKPRSSRLTEQNPNSCLGQMLRETGSEPVSCKVGSRVGRAGVHV